MNPHVFILVLIHFMLLHAVNAQSPLPDVVAAFNKLDSHPKVIYFKKNNIKIPSGGHLQGIQSLSDSQFVITASSGTYAYYLKATLKTGTDNGKIEAIQKIKDSPFRHAGGCQVYDHRLLVGIEDNIEKDKSDIIMISFGDSMKQTNQSVVAHRSGSFKRSTAGAVGLTHILSGQYLAAVGDWDSKNIDFYTSEVNGGTNFGLLATFHAPDDAKWCSYQSINLLTDTEGKMYLIGFALDGTDNRADLFELALQPHAATLTLISTRNFNCKGASFRYGAGLGISNGKLAIYSCSRNAGAYAAVNIFK